MATGDLIKLGTLYMGGTKRNRPTDPIGGGNSHAFSAGQAIEIRNTESADADKMQWREINDGGKKYLVGDRVPIHSVSWDDLNAQGLITGKTIKIDGQDYKLRSLTGGEEKREGGTGTSYAGGKLPNEWDRWIVNEANLPGLPIPKATDLAGKNPTGAHNQIWNWDNMYSWAQDTYLHNGSSRASRGYSSARYWSSSASSVRYAYYGFRPVLEVLNSAPLITGDTQAQGNKTAPFAVNYKVSDAESDAVSIIEKLNGVNIKSETNITQGVNRTITITNEQWEDLALGDNTITIEATDGKLTEVYEFNFFKLLDVSDSLERAVIGTSKIIFMFNGLKQSLVDTLKEADPSLNPLISDKFVDLISMVKDVKSPALLSNIQTLNDDLDYQRKSVSSLENQILTITDDYEGGIL